MDILAAVDKSQQPGAVLALEGGGVIVAVGTVGVGNAVEIVEMGVFEHGLHIQGIAEGRARQEERFVVDKPRGNAHIVMLGDIVAAFGELGGAVEIAETEFVFKPADGQVLTRQIDAP